MQFEFATAARIIFGCGKISEVAPIAKQMGDRALVICGKNLGRVGTFLDMLAAQEVEYITFQVIDEPTIRIVEEGINLARQIDCDFVIGIGGGSVIDTGKVIAALFTNHGKLFDYLEVIGCGKKLTRKPAQFIAIPTTSGTGAEVTRNAVLKSSEHGIKVSMRSPLMLPDLTVVDPELTYSMPCSVTASTGLDALTQLIEAFVTKKANPLTDSICREGIKRAARSLKQAYLNGNDRNARNDMSIASLFSGMALANAGLGAVHGFAGPLGGIFPAPHGVICARLLPFVMEANIRTLKTQPSNSPVLVRFDEIAKILTGKSDAIAEDGMEWVLSICKMLKVQSLSKYGLKEEDFPAIIEKSRKASSMEGNPVHLSNKDLTQILKKTLF